MDTDAPAIRLATAAMGTRFEIVLPGSDVARLRPIGEAALEEVEALHRRLTRFAASSLLSHINRVAAERPVRLDAATFALFEDALEVHRASGGAFDITVAPLMAKWGFGPSAVGAGSSPRPLPRTGMDAIELDPATRTIRFLRPGVSLDLGAIAKGHAVDRAAAVLREHDVQSALVHGGTSSVAALGSPEGESGWRVALGPNPGARIVTLRDTTLSVSGRREPDRQADGHATKSGGGPRPSHIMDPHRGEPLTGDGPARVAVIGPSARLGDAWATALLVLGKRPTTLPDEWTTYFL